MKPSGNHRNGRSSLLSSGIDARTTSKRICKQPRISILLSLVFGVFVVLLHYLMFFSDTVYAWSDDPTVNTPICTASNNQLNQTIISDSDGGAIITWEDYRSSSNYDIYAQRINASGAIQWTPNGEAICTVSSTQWYPRITGDSWGGAIITWEDYRNGTADIYAQRINSSGVVQWTTDGEAICWIDEAQQNPQIISAGWGGAIITWEDDRATGPGNINIYAQRINTAGATRWTTYGEAICLEHHRQYSPTITSDGAGGAIIAWRDDRNGNPDIYVQRINAYGVVQWTTDGEAICTASDVQYSPTLISDGAGGAIIAWRDDRSGTDDIYAQRIDASGAIQWSPDGEAICSPSNCPTITSDGAGGAIIAWEDYRWNHYDIYAQRVNASGTSLWYEYGVAICTASDDQWTPTIISDGAGGAIIAWRDDRNGNYDIYAQRIDASGAIQWTPNGVAICTASDDQWTPRIISDGAGGAIITWQDYRNGYSDIYAQRIYKDGKLKDSEDFPWILFYPAIVKYPPP